MKASRNVITLIEHYEGYSGKAYVCPAGKLTIGFGSTRVDGKAVQVGQTCTKDEAEEYVIDEIEGIEATIEKVITVKLRQGQWDAVVDFCFNLGTGAFGKSTLLKKINQNDFVGAFSEFGRWSKALDPKTGVRVDLAGLVKRRAAEAHLFANDELPNPLP